MKTVVIINGQGGSGKDTFIELCIKHMVDRVFSFSSIDPYKECFKRLGWDGKTKGTSERKFLSDFKDLSIKYNNFPTRYILKKIESVKEDNSLIFLHIREIPEIESIIELLNVRSEVIYHKLLIIRTPYTIPGTLPVFGNKSDDFVYDTVKGFYDFVIINDGTMPQLEQAAIDFLHAIGIPTI